MLLRILLAIFLCELNVMPDGGRFLNHRQISQTNLGLYQNNLTQKKLTLTLQFENSETFSWKKPNEKKAVLDSLRGKTYLTRTLSGLIIGHI